MICCGVDGHGPNKPCVFPFIYKKISYSQCIANDNDKLWCSTEVDAHGKYNGKWGNCDSNCGTGTLINLVVSHCLDLDLNGKRPGVTSDGNFSSYLIVRS
jgi:hypothetical protein